MKDQRNVRKVPIGVSFKEASTRNFIKKRLQHATLSKRDFNTQLYQKETSTRNFIKKRLQLKVFSCEYCEILKNTYFEEHF